LVDVKVTEGLSLESMETLEAEKRIIISRFNCELKY
jgi:hypothetical protein